MADAHETCYGARCPSRWDAAKLGGQRAVQVLVAAGPHAWCMTSGGALLVTPLLPAVPRSGSSRAGVTPVAAASSSCACSAARCASYASTARLEVLSRLQHVLASDQVHVHAVGRSLSTSGESLAKTRMCGGVVHSPYTPWILSRVVYRVLVCVDLLRGMSMMRTGV